MLVPGCLGALGYRLGEVVAQVRLILQTMMKDRIRLDAVSFTVFSGNDDSRLVSCWAPNLLKCKMLIEIDI